MSVQLHNEIYSKDIIESSNYLVQYLRDSGFEGNLDDGTALYDLLIKPTALIYALFSKQISTAKSYFSLAEALKNKEYLGAEYHAVIDSLLSNWFVHRKDGLPATGITRLIFTKPLDELQITTDRRFTYSGVVYSPIFNQTFNASDFIPYLELNRSLYYYIDIPIVSVTNTSQQIAKNSVFATSFGNAWFVRAIAYDDFEPGEAIENSEAFVRRTKDAITTRELISYKAIKTELTQKVPALTDVFIAGYGDYEQIRDRKTFAGVEVHVGNCADIYLHSKFKRRRISVQLDSNQNASLQNYPIVHFFGIYNSDEVRIEDYHLSTRALEFYWSNRGYFVLYVNEALPEDSETTSPIVFIDCLVNEEMDVAEKLLFSSEGKVTCYDPLIKSAYPVIVSVDLACKIENTAFLDHPLDHWEKLLKRSCVRYINNLEPRAKIKHSQMYALMHNEIPALQMVRQPMDVTFEFCDVRLLEDPNNFEATIVKTNPNTDLSSLYFENYQSFTENTVKFYSDETFVNVQFV